MSSDSRKISHLPAFRWGTRRCDTHPYTVLGDTRNSLAASRTLRNPYRPIILNCRHIPSNLACIVFSKLQLDLTPSQFPPSFPLATGLRPRDSEGSAFNFFNPDHPIHHCVGSVGCSPYLSIREISMRTLCRCLHTLHAYTSGPPPRGCCTSFARAASGTNPIPRYVVPWLPRFFCIPRSDNDLANALIGTGFSLLIAHHSR